MIYERFGKWWGRLPSLSQLTFVSCCFPPSIVCRLLSSQYMENRPKIKMRSTFGPKLTTAVRNNEAVEQVVMRLSIEEDVTTLSWSIVESTME